MGIRKLNPVTAGTRHRVITDFEGVTTRIPEPSLTSGRNKSGGRNHTGKMTMRYIGGGHKQRYRIIDLKRNKHGIAATVKTIEYDPNRSARIALLVYADGEKRYMLAPSGLKVGQQVISGPGVPPEVGNTLPLGEIPLGTLVHNIEMQPGQGGSMARSAGTFAQLAAREGRYATLKMPSGEVRMILCACLATVGTVGNAEHMLQKSGKAGRSRWQGRRPRTRAVAMNPVDHPMGGGEGRASGGHPRSRKGLLAKGKKTRHPKNTSSKFIIARRNSKAASI
ncbi:MAG: 50S ribosomal protein L2 [Flavobacteriales bacterium]|jgi:large subunit ribosomal protein L2|nr:50S ribosomal protein L2 [Flavobacteriales bacterium]MBK7083629.1 50S ribosomal protein L2 [Flavobacteriales bacterium]MBK7269870.1 50S ribosomal protein L2 [Flavobacteriales bacterium]MBK7753463.1 50S ribosomal protein L2 [Flavobacteriales bacterium]MBK9077101.1 50S ribosomal protein L2 [Flavobacteriales bacterium]